MKHVHRLCCRRILMNCLKICLMMKKVCCFLFLLVLPGLCAAQVLNLSEFELSNGLSVVIGENHKAPIAKVMLVYKVGAADEVAGKSGLAHLLEHLMFRGTTNVSGERFNTLMLENGVDFNAFTSRDITAYHALTDISRLELVLALEADRMANLKIDDEAFSAEQKIVYQERQQRVENNSKARFSEDVNKIFWQNTPYEHPVSGVLKEINALSKEDTKRFYDTYYTPSNAVLVIVGDVTVKEIKPLVEKYFGGIQKKRTPERKMFFSIEDGSNIFISKEMNDVEKTMVSVSYAIPSVVKNKKAAYAFYVFSSYFGESGANYLKKYLVDEQKVVAATSSVQILSRGSGEFEISVLPNGNDDFKITIDMIDEALNNAIEAFDEKALENEKKKILSWFVYIKDNVADEAYFIGQLKALGMNEEDIEHYVKNIENVSIKDVKDLLPYLLKTKKMTSVLLPKEDK